MVENQSPSVLSVSNWLTIWEKRFDDVLDDAENFRFDPTNRFLTHVGGQANSLESIEGQFGGIYTLTPSAWEAIKSSVDNLNSYDTTAMLQEAIHLGMKFRVVEYTGFWAEIDSQNDIEKQS
jgi:choline kinase